MRLVKYICLVMGCDIMTMENVGPKPRPIENHWCEVDLTRTWNVLAFFIKDMLFLRALMHDRNDWWRGPGLFCWYSYFFKKKIIYFNLWIFKVEPSLLPGLRCHWLDNLTSSVSLQEAWRYGHGLFQKCICVCMYVCECVVYVCVFCRWLRSKIQFTFSDKPCRLSASDSLALILYP